MSDPSRRFGRFQVDLASTCTFDGQSYGISVLNLSVGGCFFTFTDSDVSTVLPIEGTVELTIPLQNLNHTLLVESRVAWVDKEYGYGCSFERLKPLDVWSLIQFTRSPEKAFQVGEIVHIDQEID